MPTLPNPMNENQFWHSTDGQILTVRSKGETATLTLAFWPRNPAELEFMKAHLPALQFTERSSLARIGIEAGSGIEVATLEGYAAILGRGAAIKVEIHDPEDWEWALEMWRSLAPAVTGQPSGISGRGSLLSGPWQS